MVRTISFRLLYGLVILQHGRRRLVRVGITSSPTPEWIAGQVTEAFPWDEAPKNLVRDRDRAYGLDYKRRIRAMGIRDHPTAPHSPWQNGHAERVIGSIRRECLDHPIVFGEVHLRRILTAHTSYYNRTRAHLSLGKDAPVHRQPQRFGEIVALPILGGIHHQYVRVAFSRDHQARDAQGGDTSEYRFGRDDRSVVGPALLSPVVLARASRR